MNRKPITYDGQTFATQKECLAFYGIKYDQIRWYQRQGVSFKTALDICLERGRPQPEESLWSVCKRLDKNYNSVRYRITELGMSREQALSMPGIGPWKEQRRIRDRESYEKRTRFHQDGKRVWHDGKLHNSLRAASRYAGVPHSLVYYRLYRLNWPLCMCFEPSQDKSAPFDTDDGQLTRRSFLDTP